MHYISKKFMESDTLMKFIDIENWNRKDHYNYFKQLNYPHFNICANLDITKFYRYIKENTIPRIAWGKYFEENGKIKLPLSVQVNHSMADGVHVGRYFNAIQEILDNPVKYL